MLDSALTFLRDELNAYLATRLGQVGNGPLAQAELTRVVEDNGKYALAEDSIGITLLSVEEERALRSQLPTHSYVDGHQVTHHPELKLNLHVLVAAHFKVYGEALKHLAAVLTFFQAHPAFDAATHGGLDARLGRLSVELESLNYEQLNQVWAFVGAKHLPSAVYRVRVVVLQDREPHVAGPPILAVNTSVSAR